MEAIILLKKIINKGGIIGSLGKLYTSNETLAECYIIECCEQLDIESARVLWGKKLIKQIATYKKGTT